MRQTTQTSESDGEFDAFELTIKHNSFGKKILFDEVSWRANISSNRIGSSNQILRFNDGLSHLHQITSNYFYKTTALSAKHRRWRVFKCFSNQIFKFRMFIKFNFKTFSVLRCVQKVIIRRVDIGMKNGDLFAKTKKQ